MDAVLRPIEEARALVAAGDARKALEILRDLAETTDDPELRHEIHELAETAHDSSHGFQKMEWERLVIDTKT